MHPSTLKHSSLTIKGLISTVLASVHAANDGGSAVSRRAGGKLVRDAISDGSSVGRGRRVSQQFRGAFHRSGNIKSLAKTKYIGYILVFGNEAFTLNSNRILQMLGLDLQIVYMQGLSSNVEVAVCTK